MEESNLLKELCKIPSTSGDEGAMKDFLLQHIQEEKKTWKVQPTIFSGEEFQEAVILVFGQPRVAIFSHTDTVGYVAAYDNQLVKSGGPKAKDGSVLVGRDKEGDIKCVLRVKPKTKTKPESYSYEFERKIERGTPLTYLPVWKETKNYFQCCYMDNRLGVFTALLLCREMEHGAIVFSTYEEHGGGTAQYAGKFLQENYGVRKALICDVSLTTSGIKHGKGPVISMRDRGIPRQKFVRQIISIAEDAGIPFQREVESAGGSDGNQLQGSSWIWDWCFIGPPESNYHTPDEKVHKEDFKNSLQLYKNLIAKL